jgi:peroxiredoxin
MANNSAPDEGLWVDKQLAALHSNIEWQPDISHALARLRTRQSDRRRRFWTAAAVMATGLIVVALPQPRVFAHYCLDCTVSFWQNLAAAEGAIGKLETVRRTAPDFTLNDANGKPVQLASFKGKVVLLDFWATWCHGCQREIPWFVEFERRYKDQGFEAIGVSMDDDGWKSVSPFVEQNKVNYTIVIGNQEVSKRYSVDAMPVTLLIDRQGKIAASCDGVVSKSDWRSKIEMLLREKPDLSHD